ncbi:hypothetical protein E2C01_049096 [Portunus trituberculatus]|uniref:Uncharacterized protein n=1 Tax=Portunus trituberculatus TaxID=210409 RepID=A0A5B7GCR9_PORTR|nr:hypothetical protein [Portunus trituberculatus]
MVPVTAAQCPTQRYRWASNRSGRVYRLTRTGDHQVGGSAQPPTASPSSHPLFPHHLLSLLTPPTPAHYLASFPHSSLRETQNAQEHEEVCVLKSPLLMHTVPSYISLDGRLATPPLTAVLSRFLAFTTHNLLRDAHKATFRIHSCLYLFLLAMLDEPH